MPKIINDTTLNIRIDSKTKREASKLFQKMGMDISTAVKIFLNSSISEKSLPFQPRTINGFTPEYEKMILKERDLMIKQNKKGLTYNEFIKEVNSW